MALKFSTGLRNFLAGYGCLRQALEDCELKIYSGTAPATADAAKTGTLLVTMTKSSGTTTLSRGWGEIVLLTVGDCDAGDTVAFTCTSSVDGAITTATYTNTPTVATVAGVAVRLVHLFTDVGFRACATGQDGKLYVMGHDNQSLTIVATAQAGSNITVSPTDAQYATQTNDCLRLSIPAAGVITKDTGQTWSGVAAASGTAGYFRLVQHDDDGEIDLTDQNRIQGNCSTSGAELDMSTIALTSGATYTVDSFEITFPIS